MFAFWEYTPGFFLFRESCNLKFACVLQVEFSSRSTFLETRLGWHGFCNFKAYDDNIDFVDWIVTDVWKFHFQVLVAREAK
jgi:hypothetical protein